MEGHEFMVRVRLSLRIQFISGHDQAHRLCVANREGRSSVVSHMSRWHAAIEALAIACRVFSLAIRPHPIVFSSLLPSIR